MDKTEEYKRIVAARAKEVSLLRFEGNDSRLAEQIGWDQSRLSRVLNLKTKSRDPYDRLVDAIHEHVGFAQDALTSPVSLLPGQGDGGQEQPRRPKEAQARGETLPVKRTDKQEDLQRLFKDEIRLTIYTEVRASAGSGVIIYDEASKVVISVPRPLLAQFLGFLPPSELGAMICDGDSMSPTFEDGDLLLYQPVETVNGGGIYALIMDGYLIAKRVQRFAGGAYTIISDNKNSGYQDETLLPGESGQLISERTKKPVEMGVVGKILWPRRDAGRMHVQIVGDIIKSMMASGVIRPGDEIRR